MKFKTDENLPREAATYLRDAGYDAETVWEESLSGATDEVIASCVRREARVLLTLDLDFANVQAYPPERYVGVIVLRLKRQDKAMIFTLLQRVVHVLEQRSPVGELWIVQNDRIRFRHSR